MKAKYFIAENREAAETAALGYFRCGREDVTFEPADAKEETGPCQILALVGPPANVANMDAHYGLYYESGGVYLELYKERGAGEKLDADSLMHHLVRKGISNANATALQSLIARPPGRAKIAAAQQENIYGEDISVTVSWDDMQAEALLLAPEPGGEMLDIDTAKQKLRGAGVTFGVDEQALSKLLEAKNYNVSSVVAVGTQPEDGENAKLTFHFSTDERTGSPREIEGGKVDYRSLDLYVPVTEGQLIVTRTPATEGHPGQTVRGNVIKHKPGKEMALPRGKNVTVNDEKTEMRAQCSGMVEYVKNTVSVSNVYKINGDCDISIGNIDFDGSVHVVGSIRSGHTVKASGSVVVGGLVEAATIIAGGNVEVKGGMQGADRGVIEAGGSVSIQYVERGTVLADGSVTLDVSLHSFIEAGDTLTAKGRRGAIIGGRAGSTGNIVANVIGAISNTRTEIVVGVMPRKRARLQFLDKEIERLEGDQGKLDQLDAYLKKNKEGMDPEKWDRLYRSGVENRRQNGEVLDDYRFERDSLRYELEHSTEGRIHVFDTLYRGSRVLIGSGMYNANDEITYASFRYSDGEVVYGPCEMSKPK